MNIYPYGQLPPTAAVILVHAVPAAFTVLVAACIAGCIRHLRRAYRLRVLLPSTRIAPGPHVVLHGTVETLRDTPPITVEIAQEYRPNPGHPEGARAWLEVGRTVQTEPFVLRLSTGERIRVEPDARTMLIDDTIGTAVVHDERRLRRAQLDGGRAAFVSGAIAQTADPAAGYRGGSDAVLRPAKLVSTARLDLPARRRARHYALAGAACAGLGLLNLGLLSPLRLLHGGAVVQTEILQLHVVKKGKGDDQERDSLARLRVLRGQPHAGHVFEQKLWESDYTRLRPGDRLPARLILGRPGTVRLGSRPSFAIPWLVGLGIGLVLAGAIAGWASSRRSGWWEPPFNE